MINPIDKITGIVGSEIIQDNEKKKKESQKQEMDSATISSEAKKTLGTKKIQLKKLADKGIDINILMKVDAQEPLLRQDKITLVQKRLLENYYADKKEEIITKIAKEIFG